MSFGQVTGAGVKFFLLIEPNKLLSLTGQSLGGGGAEPRKGKGRGQSPLQRGRVQRGINACGRNSPSEIVSTK